MDSKELIEAIEAVKKAFEEDYQQSDNSILIIGSCDHPEKIQGMNHEIIYFNEVMEYTPEQVKQIESSYQSGQDKSMIFNKRKKHYEKKK